MHLYIYTSHECHAEFHEYTWFRPPLWDLLVLQLLRPDSSNLPCLYSTFRLEYPLVLSRFCLYLTSRPVRCPSTAKIYKWKKPCPKWDSSQQSWDLKSDALPTELRGLCWKLYYLNCLYTYMFFRYQYINWHNFKKDGVQIILSRKCTFCEYWIY